MRLTRLFLFCLIGAVVVTAIGVVTNLLTADGSWQAILASENRLSLFLLVGLTLLAGLVAFVDSAENRGANGGSQDQAVTGSTLTNSRVMQGQAYGDNYQIQTDSVVIHPPAATGQPTLSHAEITNRKALLAKVHNNWIKGVLNRSLYSKARITLGLEDRPDMVMRPWGMEYSYANQRRLLPPGTRLISKLQELGEGATLLILGDPGSGKTTMLLELADDLLNQATPTQAHGVLPVVFNLSSWSQFRPLDPKQAPTLKGWLVREFKNKYQIPENVAQAWIDQNQLVLLLDGLDEVAEARRVDCLNAINQFTCDHGTTEIVVCCRIRDFEALPTALQFQAAVYIEPLNPQQVDTYLSQGGDRLRGIRTVLQLEPELKNPDPDSLKSLAETPLFLNIMALAFEGRSVEDIQKLGANNQRRALFDAYIERMFAQRTDHPRYPKAQAKWWLHRLAQQLVQEGQTVFLIEYMQPKSWLKTAAERWQNRLIWGLILGLIWGLILGLIWGLIRGLILGLILGLIGGLIDVEPIESFQISMSRAARREIIFSLRNYLIWGLIWGLILGLILGLIWGLIWGLILGLIAGLTQAFSQNIQQRSHPNQGILNSIKNSIFVVIVSLVLMPFIYWGLPLLVSGILDPESVDSLVAGLLPLPIFYGFMFGGGLAWVGHLALRTTLLLNGHTPRNYAHFLHYAEQRLFVQRVGGGYIFVHRLLLEHFANLKLAKPSR